MQDVPAITRLLVRAREGDSAALEELLPLVYDELRSIARRNTPARRGHTLDTTAVVHEAYLKVFGLGTADLKDRSHFFGVVCMAMRQVLRDHARRRQSEKRGGGVELVSLKDHDAPVQSDLDEFLALDQALDRLRETDPRLAEVVQLRFFAGLSVVEVAELSGVTERTVLRDWKKARLLLMAALEEDDHE